MPVVVGAGYAELELVLEVIVVTATVDDMNELELEVIVVAAIVDDVNEPELELNVVAASVDGWDDLELVLGKGGLTGSVATTDVIEVALDILSEVEGLLTGLMDDIEVNVAEICPVPICDMPVLIDELLNPPPSCITASVARIAPMVTRVHPCGGCPSNTTLNCGPKRQKRACRPAKAMLVHVRVLLLFRAKNVVMVAGPADGAKG